METKFFYHSFPRRQQSDYSRGLKVLESMLKSGLLLTPEVISWREPGLPADSAPAYSALQIRICFTELSPVELFNHSQTFGQFALEFAPDQIRELGAIPVFYVPNCAEAVRGFSGAGQALVMRLAQIQMLLSRLIHLKQQNQEKQAVEFLSQNLVSLEQLGFSVMALQSLLFPAENLTYTDELGYYRQREWRIIENFAIGNDWPFRALEPSEKSWLTTFDDFFQRDLNHPPSGNGKIIDRCRFFSSLQGMPVMNRVRRIIVPPDALNAATKLVKDYGVNIPVTTVQNGWLHRIKQLFCK